MPQKITIKEVNLPATDKSPTVIVDNTGARMSGFDFGLKALQPGDTIEAELEVKGKYINIKTFKVVEKARPEVLGKPAEEVKKLPPTSGDDNTQRTSIERQVSAKLAFEFADDNMKLRQILDNAEVIFQWIHKLLPNAAKPVPDKVEAPKKPAQEESGSKPFDSAQDKPIQQVQDKPPEDRLLTKEEFSKLYKLMADYQMDIKALGNWMREHNISVPASLKQMPRSTYDKIMAGFKES